MANILIVYGSTTGNTEQVAEWIDATLTAQGHAVTVKNVVDTSVEELGGGFDLTLLGASTWGDEEIEFQEDFAPFYEEMDNAKLKGMKVGLFGCGDSSYEHFCGAVDLLEKKVEQLGAIVVNEPLRIDGDPSLLREDVKAWAAEVGKNI
jgi:flavodoxin short chain